MAETKKQSWFTDLLFGVLGIAIGVLVSRIPTAIPYQPIALNDGLLALGIAVFIFVLAHWVDSFWRQVGEVAAGMCVSYIIATLIMNHS